MALCIEQVGAAAMLTRTTMKKHTLPLPNRYRCSLHPLLTFQVKTVALQVSKGEQQPCPIKRLISSRTLLDAESWRFQMECTNNNCFSSYCLCKQSHDTHTIIHFHLQSCLCQCSFRSDTCKLSHYSHGHYFRLLLSSHCKCHNTTHDGD